MREIQKLQNRQNDYIKLLKEDENKIVVQKRPSDKERQQGYENKMSETVKENSWWTKKRREFRKLTQLEKFFEKIGQVMFINK